MSIVDKNWICIRIDFAYAYNFSNIAIYSFAFELGLSLPIGHIFNSRIFLNKVLSNGQPDKKRRMKRRIMVVMRCAEKMKFHGGQEKSRFIL